MSALESDAAVLRDDVAARLREFFTSNGRDLAAVYLFGSVARAAARESSDVDVAVIRGLPPRSPLGRLDAELAGCLERLLERPVEIVDLEHCPVDLAHRILTDGILVHEGDRSKRIAVETRQRAQYFDLQPALREYRRVSRKP
ncbi:MAG: nucleotidyltransferase domain-containing protein [Myxococcales bacterium]|nr:nucleotidyltransferase domain-containing protein [Myxococcales bacterium]